LADTDGVRAALGEQGARRAGRDYQVEPISVVNGVFHPKVTALMTDADSHLLVGSGNLTFGGWGGNLEVVEHLHPSFAADAFDDTAGFFELLASRHNIKHEADETCIAIARHLRSAAVAGRRNGDIRLVHSLDGAIASKLADFADDLGGADRLVAASPFWSSSALDRFCELLDLDDAYVHSHEFGTVQGRFGANWPAGTIGSIHAVRAEPLRGDEASRPLHAKLFEIVCRRGRIIVSGSANATTAALTSTSNVEACIVRIDRQTAIGWTLEKAFPPELLIPAEGEEESQSMGGILRAMLVADHIQGRILEPSMTGPAQVFQVTGEGPLLLGPVELDEHSSFEIPSPDLELLSWQGGRLIVRVEGADGTFAEGFVAVGSYSEIRRRVGNLAPRLFALLSGTETPADVAAIMSWFHEDPKRLIASKLDIAGGDAAPVPTVSARVSVADLIGGADKRYEAGDSGNHTDAMAWKRFMDGVFAAFRSARKPFRATSVNEPESEDEDGSNGDPRTDPFIEKSLTTFERLLNLLLAPENAPQFGLVAFDLAQYVGTRLQPDPPVVKSWLTRVLRTLLSHGDVPPERVGDIAAATLVLHATNPAEAEDYRLVRLRFLRLGVSLDRDAPDMTGVQGFMNLLGLSADYDALWRNIQVVRSLPEQARMYLQAMKHGVPTDEYPDLPTVAEEIWPTMEAALTDKEYRNDIVEIDQPTHACPRCHIVLPTRDYAQLENIRIAVARNCCGRILVCTGL
jgi:hypothetical protein